MNTNLASSSLADLEKTVNQQINQYRASKNLPPLTVDPRITKQARIHSENMASGKVKFSHDGFEGRVKAISIPYQNVAENVAYNMGYSDPARNAVDGWIKSDGHRKNIEGQFNLTGIGIAKNAKGEYYFTQIFVRSR
ncbi:CAP domain-containing protein [Tychonema sp. LEGE 07203]|uniref:CAP domain-containing protein n=1 Tax=Tychonema sp. LEGE 07203 TaxID=1828671 RepID=UPI00351C4CD0